MCPLPHQSSESTELHQAMGKLIGAPHFWVMQSRKYAKLPNVEQGQTKQLCLRNVAFIKDGNILDHSLNSLFLADCGLKMFAQKNYDQKANALTQWQTSDALLCPIKIWASITKRSLSYKGTNKILPVFPGKTQKKIINITKEMIANLCRDGVVKDWRDETEHALIRDQNKIHLLASSDGHVTCRSASLLNHADWNMVKNGVSEIHQKISPRVLGQLLLKNDRSTLIQMRSRSNRNKPNKKHRW